MRPLSPIRSPSPLSKPKITFNYPPSPLKERTTNTNPPLSSPKVTEVPRSSEQPLLSTEKCYSCQKQATYKETTEGTRYCSNCAIVEMRRGTNLMRIELKDQPFYKHYYMKTEKDKENKGRQGARTPSTHSLWTEGRLDENLREEQKVSQLVREAQALKEQLQALLVKLQDKEFASEGIKAIYRSKKMGLKNHYERIKASIKISIEKDLGELERREQCSLECLQSIKNDISSGVCSLQQVPTSLQAGRQSQLANRVEECSSVLECMREKKKTGSQIVEQLSAFEQGEEPHSDSLQVQLTQEQIEEAREELYNPNAYTLLWGRGKKSETLFSFERKNNV